MIFRVHFRDCLLYTSILSVKAGAWIMKNCPDEMGTWIDITEADRTMSSTFFGDGHGWVNWVKYKDTGEFADKKKYIQDSCLLYTSRCV